MNLKATFTAILVALLAKSFSANAQQYVLPNETIILSFSTLTGKKVVVAKDKKDTYLIYRFGTKDKIEFQYPDTLLNNQKHFKYSFWYRGGGTKNEALDLNYLAFVNGDYKYIVYETCFSAGQKTNIGIKVIDVKTYKVTDVKGNIKTKSGTLVDFRDNKFVTTDDELYD